MKKNQNTKVLLVSRNRSLLKKLEVLLPKPEFHFEWLEKLDQLIKYFKSTAYNLLLLSGEVCDDDGVDYQDVLEIISKKSPQTQILILVKQANIKTAVKALESGAYQYIRLPAPDQELKEVIEMTLEKRQKFGKNLLLAEDESIYRFEGFIGGSKTMQTVYRQIEQVASTNITVLLIGETGSGKDLAARAIHRLSRKKEGPFSAVNLGSLPSELVPSELFGHEKGAFTGAANQHKGVFETSTDGTVFLDEIESIDHKVQVSLLRLIEQRKFSRLGGKKSLRTDARIITASNADLENMVTHGNFREDLFYRLDVFRIQLPPLRERIEDISLIARELISRFNHELNKNIIRIKPSCLTALEEYEWPGNVRELKNVIQRAVLICEAEEISEKHLPANLQNISTDTPKIVVDIGRTLDEVEKQFILKTLRHTKNNRKRAAELLGITRRALYNKLHKHNIR